MLIDGLDFPLSCFLFLKLWTPNYWDTSIVDVFQDDDLVKVLWESVKLLWSKASDVGDIRLTLMH